MPESACGSIAASALPCAVGIGLKPEHFEALLATTATLGFVEIHAENYMGAGGPFHHYLARICARWPLSVHGVGLSIGGEEPLDETHLERLAQLLDRYAPASFSEHLAWSAHGGVYFNDLLPLPYHGQSLSRVCEHVDQVQTRFGRRMLLENPATYVEFAASTMDEADFIHEVVRRTGCGLLLDVSNAYIGSINHNRDALAYLDALPLDAVGEIHLAGFAEDVDSAGDRLLIDTHGAAVADAVWALYDEVLARIGPRPTLIERDQNLPSLPALLAEAHHAERMMTRHGSPACMATASA